MTTLARPLITKKVSDKTKPIKTIDPIEKRLNSIRIHLLDNKKAPKIIPLEPTLVFDNFLYLGGLKSLHDQTRLARLNITHVLSVLLNPPSKKYFSSNIKHLFLKADDSISFDMSVHFEKACQFIEDSRQSNGRVLVHCACGVSRSSALCCAYLIKHHSMSIEEAIIRLRSRRHIIQPNSAFLRQLILFDEQITCDNNQMNNLIRKLENV